MLDKVRDWFGFGGFDQSQSHAGHAHGSADGGGHGHTHGVIDPSIASNERGIWAIKWSFAILAVTAAFQLAVVYVSGSVALLADTIHNIGDATTAIPLWFAFVLARRKPSKTFTYGLGRAEDLAGILIVLIILFSALVAGYQAITRLVHPQAVEQLGWLAVAGFVGFLGNEIVAVFRIRVGRQMNSAALIADGYHARTDGLTSLAVVLGAFGVWLGYPLADPIIGLLITVAIFGIVWQSSRAVITRMLDGVEPGHCRRDPTRGGARARHRRGDRREGALARPRPARRCHDRGERQFVHAGGQSDLGRPRRRAAGASARAGGGERAVRHRELDRAGEASRDCGERARSRPPSRSGAVRGLMRAGGRSSRDHRHAGW